ncbi:mechanosensitive ion channel family protein [Erythrobacter sp.]|jgi:small-conductance mechanosensitive channel|uniref:mechanosensitive ion channel family protein n=1 Tax=Erythrobacter sp. TaxID=1042 RepID=UPI002E9DE93D|nr:mechanosensitive ion channel domain-containing protein [Erythrobacter sp.]
MVLIHDLRLLLAHGWRALLCALVLACAAPAFAVLPEAALGGEEPAEAEAEGEVAAEIAQTSDEGEDTRIRQRIEAIYSVLPAFENVEVEVSEGVVSLVGTLPDAEAIDRAEEIAANIAGVVTVDNGIERDLSVAQNLSILSEATELAQKALAALPLLAVAVAVALAIGALGYFIAGLGFIWNRIAPNAFLAELIRGAIRLVFVVVAIVVALDLLGAGALLGAVLGGAGLIGLAVGFAMRDTAENYVASIMLSLRQPFRPNDHVLIDDLEGRVIRLTSRATVLMTLEGNHLRIPNAQVFKAVILNYTRNPQRRFDFELGVDADDDPRAAMKVGTDALAALSFVLADPAPAARITQVGDSNIVIFFIGWIDQREADWFKSRSLAIAAVKEALEDEGFALPEPIYRLRFDGRTDPLPIGRTGTLSEAQPKKSASAARTVAEDVQPESEISELVEAERRGDGDQANDLLDESRPVE